MDNEDIDVLYIKLVSGSTLPAAYVADESAFYTVGFPLTRGQEITKVITHVLLPLERGGIDWVPHFKFKQQYLKLKSL